MSDGIARSIRGYNASKVSVVLTNVPSPSQKLYFAGRLLETIVFQVLQSGSIGVGISLFSYAGQVNSGLITERGLAPDPDTVVTAFQEEYGSLIYLAHVQELQARRSAEFAPHAGSASNSDLLTSASVQRRHIMNTGEKQ